MAQPTPYVPATDFSDHTANQPDVPQDGTDMDAEFQAIKTTTDQIRTNLALIQRDDGKLANGIVTPASLSDEIYAGISRAIPWATATDYLAGDLVWYLSVLYSANEDHTSTTNPTIDTANWTEILDMTATAPDIITQDAQDAANAAGAAQAAAEAAATSTASLVTSVAYLWAGTAGGTANTLVLTPQPTLSSYTPGHKLRFIVGTTNTSAVQMNTNNALGVRTIKKTIGGALVDLAPGDMVAATIAEIEYISDAAGYQLMNPPDYSQGSSVASATTVNLDTTSGDYVSITGTTTIAGITLTQGRERTVTFAGALTLTHSASLLLKNNGSNITTVAGDSAVFRGEASGVVRMVSYARASGVPIADTAANTLYDNATSGLTATTVQTALDEVVAENGIKLQSPVNVNSGTSVTLTSSIPAGVREIIVDCENISFTGSESLQLDLNSETSGYVCGSSVFSGTTAFALYTNAFRFRMATAAANGTYARFTLTLMNASTNKWYCEASGTNTVDSNTILTGTKSLSGALTTLRLNGAGGGTFDGTGTASVSWRF